MFNPNARWDRPLPEETIPIEEPIEVSARFRKGGVFPVWFIWKGRKIHIRNITYRWQDKKGSEILFYFSVSDGANLYEMHLNNRCLSWRLNKVCPI